MKKTLLASAIAIMAASAAQATVTLPSYFSDDMIVQQKATLNVKGKASHAGTVTVNAGWAKQAYTGKTDANGNFSINVPTPKASLKAYTITVSDGDKLTLNNVLVGEVWVCSGQSNMEMPINGWGKVKDYEQELKNANYDNIRLLQVKRVVSNVPTDNLILSNGEKWNVCSTQSADNFSATAYFFARRLWNVLHIPIGVIDTSWGGTPAEAWTSTQTLKTVIGFEESAAELEQIAGDQQLLKEKHERDIKKWTAIYNKADEGMDGNTPRWINGAKDIDDWKTMKLPNAWEWAGLPNFDGIVWFQKVVTLPDHWVGKDLKLKAGKVDDEDWAWFNGTQVGNTNGYWIERVYDVPAALVKDNKAIITIKVRDENGLGGICGDANMLELKMGDETLPLAGDWHYNVGLAVNDLPRKPENTNSQNFPSNLYNSMIYPLRDFAIQGAIWYQGESNADWYQQYTSLFQAMIQDWRKLWKKEIPFYFVQIANWQERHAVQPDSRWAFLRETQTNALQLANTGMAVTIDIGEAYDIHPKNKQEVGLRLANAALAQTYKRGQYNLPLYNGQMKVNGNKATLNFNQALTVQGEKVEGFIIAGPDMKFHTAQATVSGNKVTVWSPEVAMPIAVRYAWGDNPANNVRSTDGSLPLTPFRTDRW